MCDCDACAQLEKLTLKFVAHEGEVATQKVKQFVELAGVDVILVHRMLKNDVPVREYALMTDAILAKLAPTVASHAKELTHDFEGIGTTRTHYIDLTSIEQHLPEILKASVWRRRWEKIKLELRCVLYYLGFKKAAPRGA